MSYIMTGTELMKSGKRFSNAMWEYSWLLQRDGKQNEFADWDKVLDEVVERGYQCLRIDVFPHQIAAGKDGKIVDEFEHIPDFNFSWTRFEPVTYNPRKGLVEFMNKCKDRGIYVGLSTWLRHDTTHRELEVETAEDFARIWIETLDFLAENDLLDGIAWVDLCNEFPTTSWVPALKEKIIETPDGRTEPREVLLMETLTEESQKKYADFMKRAITPVREKYPQLLYTFSMSAVDALEKMDYSCCDLVDVHIWATFNPDWAQGSSFLDVYLNMLPGNTKFTDGVQASTLMRHIEQAVKNYPQYKERIRQYFEKELKVWSAFAKKNDAILITTESWSTVIYEDAFVNGALGEWEWVKDVAEMAINEALKDGWTSVCTSNFCEPQFEGMWSEVEWHKKMNELIQK